MKLSGRELALLIVTFFLAGFYFYWQFVFSPLLNEIDNTKSDIGAAQVQLKAVYARVAESKGEEDREEIEISPKEEQVERIIRFLDYKFRWFGIELLSMRQYTESDKIAFDIEIRSSTFQLLGFLRSLQQIKTMLLVDRADIAQDDDESGKLITNIKLLSKYQY